VCTACDPNGSPDPFSSTGAIEIAATSAPAINPDALPLDAPTRTTDVPTHCTGTPLPVCPPGLTGPSCTLPCTSPNADASTCRTRLYCHGDGSVYGLATFGGHLWESPAATSDSALAAALTEWLITHEADLGLASGLTAAALDLAPIPELRNTTGRLGLLRFRQRYRSFPVLPPDDLVQLVVGPQGPIQLTGRIVDGREIYANTTEQSQCPSSARPAATMFVREVKTATAWTGR